MGIHHGIVLDGRRQGEEQLATCLNGGRQPHVDAKAPLQILVSLVPARRLSAVGASQTIAVLKTSHLKGVGLTRLKCVEHHVAMGVQHEAHHGGIFFKTQNLVLQLDAQFLPAKTELQAVVDISHQLSTRNVDVAGNGLERQDAVARLSAI